MLKSIEELNKVRQEAFEKMNLRKEKEGIKIVVGMGTCGIEAGARQVVIAFLEEVSNRRLEHVIVSQTDCMGMCTLEPIVEVYEQDKEKVTYVEMTPEKVKQIIEEHIVNGRVVTEYTIGSYHSS
mgnify:CR=1 FL=1